MRVPTARLATTLALIASAVAAMAVGTLASMGTGRPGRTQQELAGGDANLQLDLQTLVRAGVPAGAVLGPHVALPAMAPRGDASPPPRNRRDLIAWMASRWAGVLTVTDGPVVRVAATTAVACRTGLAQQVDAAAIGGNAVAVMFGLARAIDPSLATLPPPGLLHGGGSAARSPHKILRDAVQLTGGRLSVEAALDQFVTRLDGWGWWVEERCRLPERCTCRVGMFTEDSVLSAVYDISPLATR
jgi:hypothetical protein